MSLNGPTLKESCTVLQCFPSIVNCPSQHRHCEEVFGIVLTSWNNVLAWASENWTQHRQETVRGPGLGFETVHHPHHITVQGRGLGLTFPPRPNDKKRARMSDGAAWVRPAAPQDPQSCNRAGFRLSSGDSQWRLSIALDASPTTGSTELVLQPRQPICFGLGDTATACGFPVSPHRTRWGR